MRLRPDRQCHATQGHKEHGRTELLPAQNLQARGFSQQLPNQRTCSEPRQHGEPAIRWRPRASQQKQAEPASSCKETPGPTCDDGEPRERPLPSCWPIQTHQFPKAEDECSEDQRINGTHPGRVDNHQRVIAAQLPAVTFVSRMFETALERDFRLPRNRCPTSAHLCSTLAMESRSLSEVSSSARRRIPTHPTTPHSKRTCRKGVGFLGRVTANNGEHSRWPLACAHA
jgi:ATP-dependent helicase YprA (DUF1998 family)